MKTRTPEYRFVVLTENVSYSEPKDQIPHYDFVNVLHVEMGYRAYATEEYNPISGKLN